MPEIPSVNPEEAEITADEGATSQWVDPIFAEMTPERLPDEIEPTTAEVAAQQAEEAATAAKEFAEQTGLTVDDLKTVTDKEPSDDPPDESEPEDEMAADEPAEEAKKPRRRNPNRTERRRLERENADLQAREIKFLARIAALEAANGSAPVEAEAAPVEEVAEEAPTLAEHDYDNDAWAKAYTEWTDKRVEARVHQAVDAPKLAEEAATAEEARVKAWTTYQDRVEDARDKYEDYDDLTTAPDLPISQATAELIVESEQGAELMYYLATNREQAESIHAMTDVAMAREIGRLETRLQTAEQAPQAAEEAPDSPSRKRSTSAPDPVPTVGGGGSASNRDPAKMSQAEYEEGRRTGKIR